MKSRFFLLICFMFPLLVFSQQGLEIIPGQIVVQLEKGIDHQLFINQYLHADRSVFFKNIISKRLDLYLFEFDPETQNTESIIQKVRDLPPVRVAGSNFRMQYRNTVPDDPDFEDQWTLERIEATEAWTITKGGLTGDNTEIVVAVIEGGDIDHEDVQGNIWVNKDEIPNDGIDNDGNGYTDDYYGVNVVDSTDTPNKGSHNTSVMGIIGAKGNNTLGVSGVSWNVKMMIVSTDLTFGKIIESYDYVFQKRKRYNETNGTEGAFVVATNASFGVDTSFPEDHALFPIWCDLYDSLGTVGVLSAGATTNSNDDIGINGDMPATCSSDYLIAVTNTDIDDKLVAGYNDFYIDLAAPGKDSYTLKPNNGYGNFSGTSAATPHVTGAIGLMYSLPCKEFIKHAKQHPAATALLVKKLILNGTDKIPSLDGKTLSGGRLNLFNSLKLLQDEFAAPKGALDVLKVYPNPAIHGQVNIEYQTPDFTEYKLRVFNALGQLILVEIIPAFCAEKMITISTEGWPSGVYFISLENQNDKTSEKFTVIDHHF